MREPTLKLTFDDEVLELSASFKQSRRGQRSDGFEESVPHLRRDRQPAQKLTTLQMFCEPVTLVFVISLFQGV